MFVSEEQAFLIEVNLIMMESPSNTTMLSRKFVRKHQKYLLIGLVVEKLWSEGVLLSVVNTVY